MSTLSNKPLIIALYLPQYYETEYNNLWCGKGYTEWVACKKAKPLFKGHLQPKIPLNNNYYNLLNVETIKWQMDLAKEYGIDGFAIYQYYSCGKKLLEEPLELIKKNQKLDLPFFLFWANESWKKAWFGQDNDVLWLQEYGEKREWKEQFYYCLNFFKDKRYIKIGNKPVYGVYNAWQFKRIDEFIKYWDELAVAEGFDGIYFIKSTGIHDKKSIGNFSAIVSREPNYSFANDFGFISKGCRFIKTRLVDFINRKILLKRNRGIVKYSISYDKIWKKIINRKKSRYTTCYGAFVDWDNSPRKSYNSIIIKGGSPEKFGIYFKALYQKACDDDSPMVVINAWNEWAEGAYLEPDEQSKYEYLKAVSGVSSLKK